KTRMSTIAHFVVIATLVASGMQAPPAAFTAKVLFSAHGSVGMRPLNPPPDHELSFAVAVVEIDSRTEIRNVSVSDFPLFDRAGAAMPVKRVIRRGAREGAAGATAALPHAARTARHRRTHRRGMADGSVSRSRPFPRISWRERHAMKPALAVVLAACVVSWS